MSDINVRLAAAADRAEWLRMRTELWPDHCRHHPREIDAILADRDGRIVQYRKRLGGNERSCC